MSTSPISFRVSPHQKKFINKVLKKVIDDKSLSKPDSLYHVVEVYDKQQSKGSTNPDDFIASNIRDAIRNIECNYLQFTDETFYCLEKFNKSKKKDILGIEPQEIVALCTSCKQGKADVVRIQIEKEQRKASVKKLMDFAKQFMVVTEKGFLATSYMCVAEALEGNMIFSRDGRTLYCTLQDNDAVDIEKTCMCALNPDTDKPPCQYLITLDHLVTISKEDLEEMNLNIPTMEYQEPPVDFEVMNQRDEPRKVVEAEIVIQDGVKKLCPDCETILSENDKGLYCHNCDYSEVKGNE